MPKRAQNGPKRLQKRYCFCCWHSTGTWAAKVVLNPHPTPFLQGRLRLGDPIGPSTLGLGDQQTHIHTCMHAHAGTHTQTHTSPHCHTYWLHYRCRPPHAAPYRWAGVHIAPPPLQEALRTAHDQLRHVTFLMQLQHILLALPGPSWGRSHQSGLHRVPILGFTGFYENHFFLRISEPYVEYHADTIVCIAPHV